MKINKLLAHSSNFTNGRKQSIKYLVIHYTANNGDLAKGNCNYFKTGNRGASAHYFVDENAIGIELCSEKDSKGNYYFNEETIKNAIELTKYLMKKYNIPVENVVRHYDVTRKNCPAPFVNNNVAWNNFKNKLKGDNYMQVKRVVEVNGIK